MARPTIRPYLLPYVVEFGKQLGTDDPTEIVNLIIFEHMRGHGGCGCDRKPLQPPTPKPSDDGSELDALSDLLPL